MAPPRGVDVATTRCVYYDPIKCQTKGENCNMTEQTCVAPVDGKRAHCYALWRNVSGTVEVEKRGCWLDDKACYNQETCVEEDLSPKMFFCCCEGDFCNKKLHYKPQLTSPTPPPVGLYSGKHNSPHSSHIPGVAVQNVERSRTSKVSGSWQRLSRRYGLTICNVQQSRSSFHICHAR